MTGDQVRQSLVQILQGLGLQPQQWAPGGGLSTILTYASNIIADITTELANAISYMWNPTATGGGLQLLSQYFYGVSPPQATFASGTLTLTNSGGGTYTFLAGQASFTSVVADPVTGLFPTYTNTANFTLNPSSTLNITIQCTTAGTFGNANAGNITQIVSAMANVTASNPNAIAGSDALTDDQLRALNTNSLAVHSVFGPRGAYAYAVTTALNSITNAPVTANRMSISQNSHTGAVTVYVASPSGPVTTPGDISGIANNINLLARPDAVTLVGPFSATAVTYNPNITIYVSMPSTVTASSLQTTILTYVNAWFASPSNPIGGITAADDTTTSMTGIFESTVIGLIAQAIATVPGCALISTRFDSRGGTAPSDLPLTTNQVAVSGLNTSPSIVTVQPIVSST